MVFILASRLLKLHGLTECVGAVPTLSKAAPKDKRCAAQKTKFGLPSAKEELGACICVVKIGICRKLLQRHYLGLDNNVQSKSTIQPKHVMRTDPKLIVLMADFCDFKFLLDSRMSQCRYVANIFSIQTAWSEIL
jgi:hypothetical protein